MKVVLNGFRSEQNFRSALAELLDGAAALDLAVGYVQVSGWNILHSELRTLDPGRVRLVFTDQMNITHPEALRLAQGVGIQLRNFSGPGVYHPKVYLAYGANRTARKYLIASANLSQSAFSTGIEAGVIGTDPIMLRTLHEWFENLYRHDSEDLTPDLLNSIEAAWKTAAASRVRSRLATRRIRPRPANVQPTTISAEDVDAVEDVFSTLVLPIGLLNMDHARNNVRTLGHLLTVLSRFPNLGSKQRSELKILGLLKSGQLTKIGRRAAQCRDEESLARTWCRWIQRTSDADLELINPRLKSFKNAISQFWKLKAEVRDFFLANVRDRTEKRTLQTIELLCNASDVVQTFSIEDFRTLSSLLEHVNRMPPYVQVAINEYKRNKGARTWKSDDRAIIPEAWHRLRP